MNNPVDGFLEPGTREVLSRQVLSGARVVGARWLTGGFSGDTVLLHTDRGQEFVLRRYPRRNTCAVEAAVLGLLADRVPVPDVVHANADGTLLGEPFLLTRFVSGIPLNETFANADEQAGAQLGQSVGQALAAVSSIRFDRPGFFSGDDLQPDARPPDHHDDLPAFIEACLARAGAGVALSGSERKALVRLAADNAPLTAAVAGVARLVHADFNAKNIMVRPDSDGWQVAAILDWEYAFSGSPLFDVGNMLRYPGELPPGFQHGFLAAYHDSGGALPQHWEEISCALDLFALSELLTRPAGHPMAAKALAVLRERIKDRPSRGS
ncbi:phosphotransferase family protein [Planomonospora sp. ID82291]|uniref:phosphotransferase family protein n=1 Tax=Planomonospora sp. ID82291 TaxID=2738136 RepID=UPI0018C3FF75|nr:phosphotransferase family protein [Planomonospora sp. ID82291]MBG0818691.1 phosphotransferase family protein [Planomonospora sp. ID82291]